MIVMKFGGTSVESAEAIERVSKIVGSRSKESPLVVVSAMAKVTDQLLTMGRAAGDGDRETALQLDDVGVQPWGQCCGAFFAEQSFGGIAVAFA